MQGDIELLRQSFAVYIETTLPFLSNMSMRCIGQELSILLKDSTKTISDICAHATKFGSSPSKSASLHQPTSLESSKNSDTTQQTPSKWSTVNVAKYYLHNQDQKGRLELVRINSQAIKGPALQISPEVRATGKGVPQVESSFHARSSSQIKQPQSKERQTLFSMPNVKRRTHSDLPDLNKTLNQLRTLVNSRVSPRQTQIISVPDIDVAITKVNAQQINESSASPIMLLTNTKASQFEGQEIIGKLLKMAIVEFQRGQSTLNCLHHLSFDTKGSWFHEDIKPEQARDANRITDSQLMRQQKSFALKKYIIYAKKDRGSEGGWQLPKELFLIGQ